ncbi:IS5 family transposase [Streptomyces sp. NPDC021218]|uniref:IS5 family transposase n=1 Tax=unclassified Streptomyces TaxID=2593676 RepID=UPI00368597A1
MSERRGYYTDTTDEQWALIEPVITAWKAAHPSVSGHAGRYEMRAIVNALLYQNRSGCQWSLLPADFPPASAVKYYFYRWRDDGLDQVIHEILRCQVRERTGRPEDPSLVVLDSQSVHAAVNVPASTTGKDATKRVPGRKRGIAVDVIGLIIAVVVMAASVHDNAIGTALLTKVAAQSATVTKALVDQGFKNTVVEHGAGLGIDVEIVERNPQDKGFVPQPIRWRVEQTLGTLMLQRRLVRDYESDPRSSESRVYWAIAATMARRLTGTTTPTWPGA